MSDLLTAIRNGEINLDPKYVADMACVTSAQA